MKSNNFLPDRNFRWTTLLFGLILVIFLSAGCSTAGVKEESTPSTEPSSPVPATPTPTPQAIPTLTATPTNKPTQTPNPPTPTATSTLTPTLPPGASRVSLKDGMTQVYVPAGKFWMGGQPGNLGADADEFPQHEVFLDAFWIDQTEVTNAMYAKFLNEEGNQMEGRVYWFEAVDPEAPLFQEDGVWMAKVGMADYPVVEVNWYGARAYCTWAGKRLPTEAEWEKAARGNDRRSFPWGEELDCSLALVANCKKNKPAPVGSYPGGASPYSALEMAGNVWEWVADRYQVDYYAISPSQNPTGPSDGDFFVVRGGSFYQNWKHARTMDRRHDGPGNTKFDYGFRCVMEDDIP